MKARYSQHRQTLAFRYYMADSLYAYGDSRRLTERLYDVLHKKHDTRSGDEIAADIINRMGLTFE